MIIGITGSIATGKSTVTSYLIKKGYLVIDSDKIVHEELKNPVIIENIRVTFGDFIVDDGIINRKKLGQIIFNDPEKRQALNDIIHPGVIKAILSIPKEQITFVDVPLLYEVNLEYLFDMIVVVYVREDIQLKRLIERDQISEDFARKKIATQMNIEIKKIKADFVINNENSIEDTHKQIDQLLRSINNEI